MAFRTVDAASGATDCMASKNNVVHQLISEDQMGEKIRSIDAEQIELISNKILSTILNRLGSKFSSDDTQSKATKSALMSVKSVVENSCAIPLAFIANGLSFKLSTSSEPVGILADIAKENKLELDITQVPKKYRVSLDLDKELTRQRNVLTFILKEISNEEEIFVATFSIKDLDLKGSGGK